MTTPAPLPAGAVEAAAEAIHRATCEYDLADCIEDGNHNQAATEALEAARPHLVAAERERLKQLLGERFKEVLIQPGNGYLVDAVAWSHLLDVLGPGADLLRQGGEGGGG